MSEKRPTLTGAIQEMSDRLNLSLDHIAGALGGGFDAPKAATSDPREEVIIRYTVGYGVWDEEKKYNVLRMKMFKMSGEWDGYHDGVWQPVQPPEEIVKQPPIPPLPYDEPVGPKRRRLPSCWRGRRQRSSSLARQTRCRLEAQ